MNRITAYVPETNPPPQPNPPQNPTITYEAGPTNTTGLYSKLRWAMRDPQTQQNHLTNGVYTQHVLVGGKESLIVYFGGTTFNPADQFILKNRPSFMGEVDDKQITAIKAALNGNTAEPILFVGYSQGGMDAQNIAAK